MAVRVSSPPSLDARQTRLDFGLSRERMARLFDVSSKTIERWEEHHALPSGAYQRRLLGQLAELAELGRIVYSDDGFRRFVSTPLPVFSGKTALQMIEQGHAEDVLAALASDYEGSGW